ncbi:MAG: YidB family protein [Gammaproteobacteria bacterium]|nr:YidB family protein [Gammaproteobacteria bacterium]
MDLKSLATKLLVNKLGGSQDESTAESALGNLIGKGDQFDLGGMVEQFTSGNAGIAEKARSWLGDGRNDEISESQIEEVMGADKIGEFAAQLGIGRDEAKSGLSDILPQLVDKGSRGGGLLDSVAGIGGLAGMASKFLK